MQIITNILAVEQLLEPYEGIIFDLDDTLYSEKDYVRSGYHQVAQALDGEKGIEERLWTLFEEGRAAIDELLKERGIYTEEKKNRLLAVYRNQVPKISLYQGLEDMLIRIKKAGKTVGMITDGRVEGQSAKIQALHLDKFFDHIIITDSLGGIEFRKPNERAFVLMKKKWEMSYEQMVYVGDNIKKDFVAPSKLGMGTIWFRNNDGLYIVTNK